MRTIEQRLERLERLQSVAGFDPSRPMVIVLHPGDSDPEPIPGAGVGPLVIDCRNAGQIVSEGRESP
jgi:hypothetical protein